MIVTAKPPRRTRQEPRKTAVACPVIVTAKKPGRRPYTGQSGGKEAPDPEADARLAAFFAKAIRPPGREEA